jgi:hypothetical protein
VVRDVLERYRERRLLGVCAAVENPTAEHGVSRPRPGEGRAAAENHLDDGRTEAARHRTSEAHG